MLDNRCVRSQPTQYGVSAPTVQRWVKRDKGKRLDRADFTHCAVESHKNNLYLKRWFILCRLVMWQIENAVTEVLALAL